MDRWFKETDYPSESVWWIDTPSGLVSGPFLMKDLDRFNIDWRASYARIQRRPGVR